ncbi:MAG: hypothetical protein IT249_13080 [Chitinophagaceae bacterium]|nr:hypothetical protein [Chitinophagaceae bacterium]
MPLVLFIFFSKSKKNSGLRVVFFLLIYYIFFNLVISTNQQLQDKYFYLLGSLTTIIEFAILSYLFFCIIESGKFKKLMWLITAVVGTFLLYFLITSPHNAFDSIPSGVTSLTLLIYSIYYLFERMKDPTSLYLFSSPVFWVVVAIVIYSAGTFFPFIYARNNMEEAEFKNIYDLIHDTLYIVKNVIFSFAIMIKPKPEKKYAGSAISKKH